MIPKVVLDPSVFWLFHESDTEEDAAEIWRSCRPWLKDNKHGVPLLVHSKSIERLRDKGMIPAFEGMRDFVDRFKLDHLVSPRELSRIVDSFLSNMVTVEEEAPIKDVLFDDAAFQPDELAKIVDADLREHSAEAATLSALNAGIGYSLLYAFPRLKALTVQMAASARIEAIESDPAVDIPDPFVCNLKVIRDPEQYRGVIDAQAIWDSATSDEELKFAIHLAAEMMGQTPPAFTIGKAFMGSLDRNQSIAGRPLSAATLAKCAQVLVGSNGLKIEEFKTEALGNRGGVVRKRTEDGACAFRVHVTKKGVGLRLMLWKLTTGEWEFANVGPKSEEKIETG